MYASVKKGGQLPSPTSERSVFAAGTLISAAAESFQDHCSKKYYWQFIDDDVTRRSLCSRKKRRQWSLTESSMGMSFLELPDRREVLMGLTGHLGGSSFWDVWLSSHSKTTHNGARDFILGSFIGVVWLWFELFSFVWSHWFYQAKIMYTISALSTLLWNIYVLIIINFK